MENCDLISIFVTENNAPIAEQTVR